MEADASDYVQNAAVAERAEDEDLDRCPPPDLALETEITVPLLPKLPVYAAIGVPEIWHLRGDLTARLLKLDDTGTYQETQASVAVPAFTAKVLEHWIGVRMNGTLFETLRRFRAEFVTNAGGL